MEIDAVHPEDLESALKSINKWKPIQEKKVNCSICQRKITTDNIGKICPRGAEVNIRCDNSSCLMGISDGSSPNQGGDNDSEDVEDVAAEKTEPDEAQH